MTSIVPTHTLDFQSHLTDAPCPAEKIQILVWVLQAVACGFQNFSLYIEKPGCLSSESMVTQRLLNQGREMQ